MSETVEGLMASIDFLGNLDDLARILGVGDDDQRVAGFVDDAAGDDLAGVGGDDRSRDTGRRRRGWARRSPRRDP